MGDTTRHFDFLVIGSGLAGMHYALRVAEAGQVAIITKRTASDSATDWAQGGIAAVMDPADSFEAHVRDTLEAGAGLCHPDTVRFVVERGPDAIDALPAFLQAIGLSGVWRIAESALQSNLHVGGHNRSSKCWRENPGRKLDQRWL